MDKVQEIGKMLRQAMTTAQARGYIIARRVTIDTEVPRCCAVGALAIVSGHVDSFVYSCTNVFGSMAKCLGVKVTDLLAVAEGFDGKPAKANEYYRLGKDLAEEFIGVGDSL